jgi:hypothetical protein
MIPLYAGLCNTVGKQIISAYLVGFVLLRRRHSPISLCSIWLTVTNASARLCFRVEEERLHYLVAFFIVIAWSTLSIFVCSTGLQSSILS